MSVEQQPRQSDVPTTPPVSIVTIQGRTPSGIPAPDLADILHTLWPAVHGYYWDVHLAEYVPRPSEKQDSRDDPGVEHTTETIDALFSSDELLRFMGRVLQTIDGMVVGFYQVPPTDRTPEVAVDVDAFRGSDAQLVVAVVDSSQVEVMTKHPSHVHLLRQAFANVRDEDPSDYEPR